jgi:hypothetical protein
MRKAPMPYSSRWHGGKRASRVNGENLLDNRRQRRKPQIRASRKHDKRKHGKRDIFS